MRPSIVNSELSATVKEEEDATWETRLASLSFAFVVIAGIQVEILVDFEVSQLRDGLSIFRDRLDPLSRYAACRKRQHP